MNFPIGYIILIWSFIYAFNKKDIIYWLLPIIVINGYSFGFFPANYINFSGFINKHDVSFLLLIFIVITNFRRLKIFRYKEIRIFSLFFLFIIIQGIISFSIYEDSWQVLKIFRRYIYYSSFIFLIFFLSNTNKKQFERFIYILSIITIIQSFLYIIDNTFNITIFVAKDFNEYNTHYAILKRDFLNYPQFYTIVFFYWFFKYDNAKNQIFISVLWVVITLISLTRFTTGVNLYYIFATYSLYNHYNKHRIKVAAKTVMKIIAISLLLYMIVINFFFAQYTFFLDRFFRLEQISITQESTLSVRLNKMSYGLKIADDNNILVGVGFIGSQGFHSSGYYSSEMSDSAWANLIPQLGIIGNFFLWWFIFYLGYSAFKCYKKEKKWIYLLIFLQSFILPFSSIFSSFLQEPQPVAYLPWAIFIVEKYNLYKNDKRLKLK